MKTFILIILLAQGNDYMWHVTTQEFHTKEACERSAAWLERKKGIEVVCEEDFKRSENTESTQSVFPAEPSVEVKPEYYNQAQFPNTKSEQ